MFDDLFSGLFYVKSLRLIKVHGKVVDSNPLLTNLQKEN